MMRTVRIVELLLNIWNNYPLLFKIETTPSKF